MIALSNEEKKEIEKFAIKIREDILFTALSAGASSSHFGGSLSTVEIISVLYSNLMNYNKKNFLEDSRDRFILSKGHGCLAYYSALHQIGLIEKNELKNFEKSEGLLFGHPIKNRNIGVEFSNGSLGMGLSLGIGVCIALIKKKLNNLVYVLLGDGECNEGSVWEAAMSAPNFNLKNLCVIVDNNGLQQTGSNVEIMNSYNLAKKWKSFGWNVIEVDGHDINEIYRALKKVFDNSFPKVLIAKTIKGKGFGFSENNNNWHHAVLTQKQYEEAIKELNENLR